MNYEGLKTVFRNGGEVMEGGYEIMLLGALHNILDSDNDLNSRVNEVRMALAAYDEVKKEI